MKDKKIVFMGTPIFAVPILEMLIKKYNVELVITQPDRLVGRKKVLTKTPIKILAEENGIRVMQPEKISNDDALYEELVTLNPDIIITAAYGQIVPEKILNLPKYRCINVHGSLLPKLRGGAPIQYSILEGHNETGVTIMYMEKGMDTGDMLSKSSFPILETDNFKSVHDKMSILGRDLLDETLPKIFSNQIQAEKQDENLVTYAPNIKREDELIDWTKDAVSIFNKIRAFDPIPGAFTYLDDKVLKIWSSSLTSSTTEEKSGYIVNQDKDFLYVACGDKKVLKIKELQVSGKTRTQVKNFLSNGKNYIGKVLGEINE